MNHRNPSSYPRRILLAVTGLSPQIVTETLHALAVGSDAPFIPTEVHLITTAEGAERARLESLGVTIGSKPFRQLFENYIRQPTQEKLIASNPPRQTKTRGRRNRRHNRRHRTIRSHSVAVH